MRRRAQAAACILVLTGFNCPSDRSLSAVDLQVRFENLYYETRDDAYVVLRRGVFALGDTSDLLALAIGGDDYKHPLYGARERPGEFVFSSSDSGVATISASGVLTARAIGESRVRASHRGFSDTIRIVVVPHVSALRVALAPSPLRVGQTGVVTLSAVDSAGAALTRAYATIYADDPALLDAADGRLTVVARAPGSTSVQAIFAGQRDVRAKIAISITP